MLNSLILVPSVIMLSGLLYFEYRENRKGLLPVKILLSTSFIIAAMVQPHPISGYYHFLLAGLVFCLGGDVFLALPRKMMFLFGLFSFLIGHIFYILSFFYVARLNLWTLAGSLTVLIVSFCIYLWLKPHLDSMNVPVIFYIIVITVMLCGAWSVLGDPNLNLSGRIMVFAGATIFYVSDVFVARDRFIKKEFLNRLIGLPMYYAGQFLLAFSIGALG